MGKPQIQPETEVGGRVTERLLIDCDGIGVAMGSRIHHAQIAESTHVGWLSFEHSAKAAFGVVVITSREGGRGAVKERARGILSGRQKNRQPEYRDDTQEVQ